jgi:hypothetical protein
MKIVLFCVLFFAAAPALAAPLIVRTGDHDGFTRVVIQSRGLQDWTSRLTPGEIRITPGEEIDGYDLRRVYDRIQRDRIVEISSSENDLILRIRCQCVARPVQAGPNITAFDIVEVNEVRFDEEAIDDLGTSATDVGELDWENSLRASEDFLSDDLPVTSQSRSSIAEDDYPLDNEVLEQSETFVGTFPALPITEVGRSRNAASLPVPPIQPSNQPRNSRQSTQKNLSQLEERLARQIGLAATQGLLTPAQDAQSDETIQAPNQIQAPNSPIVLAPTEQASFQIENASSTVLPDRIISEDQLVGLNCETPLFAVHEWGTETGFTEDISKHRNSLFEEFDEINRDVQVALARTYIFHSLGAEAMNVLELEPRGNLVDTTLRAIALIVDDSNDAPVFGDFTHCDGDIALWSILSAGNRPIVGTANSDAAIRSLSKLPFNLRSLIAPRLSQILREMGNVDGARLAIRSISRTPHAESTAVKMESAEVSFTQDNSEEARSAFSEVAVENALESPLALIRFIDLQVSEGGDVSPEITKLADAYSVEYRNTDLGKDLRRVHILALTMNHQFGAAFEALNTEQSLGSIEIKTFDQVYNFLVTDSDDVTFLRHVMTLNEGQLLSIPEVVRAKMAKRVLELGFAEKSQKIADTIEGEKNALDRILLNASILIKEKNYVDAIELLSTSEDPALLELLTEAYIGVRAFDNASSTLNRLGESTRVNELRSLLSEMIIATQNATEPVETSQAAQIESSGALSQAQTLAESARELKNELADLLEDNAGT